MCVWGAKVFHILSQILCSSIITGNGVQADSFVTPEGVDLTGQPGKWMEFWQVYDDSLDAPLRYILFYLGLPSTNLPSGFRQSTTQTSLLP